MLNILKTGDEKLPSEKYSKYLKKVISASKGYQNEVHKKVISTFLISSPTIATDIFLKISHILERS